MTCPACTIAETDPRTGHYRTGCQSCTARALAQSPAAHRREVDPADLQDAMRRMWPEQGAYRQGRALVWQWIKRLEAA